MTHFEKCKTGFKNKLSANQSKMSQVREGFLEHGNSSQVLPHDSLRWLPFPSLSTQCLHWSYCRLQFAESLSLK